MRGSQYIVNLRSPFGAFEGGPYYVIDRILGEILTSFIEIPNNLRINSGHAASLPH